MSIKIPINTNEKVCSYDVQKQTGFFGNNLVILLLNKHDTSFLVTTVGRLTTSNVVITDYTIHNLSQGTWDTSAHTGTSTNY